VFTASFQSALDTPETHRKLVEVKAPKGLVDMYGRPYPRNVALWVHHYDDFGALVEGTYDIILARRAIKKAGYDVDGFWGYRPIVVDQELANSPWGKMVGGRSCVAFYFDVSAALDG
jgi:hypothetical protein